MKPLIGIVGRSDVSTKEKNTICVFDNYRKAVILAGGNPIAILPPQPFDYGQVEPRNAGKLTEEEKNMLTQQLSLCHAFIIQGGSKAYDYDRFVIDYANIHHIPILGICLGMQQMCNYNNRNQNIPNDNTIHKNIDADYVHTVTIDKDSKLYSILLEESFQVNSHHNYHVPNSGDYDIAGYSMDGLIEAVEKKQEDFNIGVQWHPEKNFDTDIYSQRLLKSFI